MAKKKTKKVAKKVARKAPAPVEVAPNIVVFYELRDVAGVRYHTEHNDIERARIAARSLVSSEDVSQAWIIRDIEIVTRPNG